MLAIVFSSALVAGSSLAAGFEPAKRTHAPELKPPNHQAGSGIEGWVTACVTVKEDGTVGDVRVIDLSPNEEFAEAGKSAAEGWKFKPAQFDGKPTEEADVCDIQLFTVGSPFAAKTTATLEGAAAFLDEEEFDNAKRALKDLAEDGPLTLTQAARLQLLESRIAANDKDEARAVEALERATISGGRFLKEDARLAGLGARFQGLVNARRYRDALDLFATFESLDGGAQPMVIFGPTAAEIRDLEKSGKSFAVPGKLEPALAADGGVWRHRPLRREVGVQDVEGKITALSIECDRRKMRLDYQEDISLTIPESWGSCSIYVEGTPDTTLRLVEYGGDVG